MSRLPIVGSGYGCNGVLTALSLDLRAALKIEQEKKHTSGFKKHHEFRLTYALCPTVIDSHGNILVHSRCLREFLSFFTSYVADVHRLGGELSGGLRK